MRVMTLVTVFSVFLTGCSEKALTRFNASPEVAILSHEDGDTEREGEPVLFLGQVSDPDHKFDELETTWKVNGEVACESAPPAAGGSTECLVVLDELDTRIALEVSDPEGKADAVTIELTIVPTDAPNVRITSPLATGVYYSDEKIEFSAVISDEEDAVSDLVSVWTSDSVDDPIEVDTTANSDGEITGFAYLAVAEHAITLTVTDTSGKTDTDEVVINVGPPNSPPSCSIISPATGEVSQEGESVILQAEVSDVDVPSDWLSAVWTSDKDGDLGTVTPTTDGDVTLPTSELSSDTHNISLTVTDEAGETCTDAIVFTVNAPPSVTIEAPGDGEVFLVGSSVTLSGLVSDPEDLEDTMGILWSSSVLGELDSTPADATGRTIVVVSDLEVGAHTVTLLATDSQGATASDVVTFTIDDCTVTRFHLDADGDGFGDPDTFVEDCTAPSGYVASDTDCDDTDIAVNPAATEVCDGIDNDCDGLIDPPGTPGTTTYYRDADSDSYGDPLVTVEDCSAPAGYVADDTDCDDSDGDVNPGATEICNDFIDNDCDGTDNGCSMSGEYLLADADVYWMTNPDHYDVPTLYPSSELSNSNTVVNLGDTNGDGSDDLIIRSNEEDNYIRSHIYTGVLSGEQHLYDDDSASIRTRYGAQTAAGDVDGDGYADVMAAGGSYCGSSVCTKAYVFYGPFGSDLEADYLGSDADVGIIIEGGASSGLPESWGDTDGDDVDDLLIAHSSFGSLTSPTGAVYLVRGPPVDGITLADDADAIIVGESGMRLGNQHGFVGDLNADGFADIFAAGTSAESVYIEHSPIAGTSDVSDMDTVISGWTGAVGLMGTVGDVNDDGIDDVGVQCCAADGRLYIFSGPLSSAMTPSDALMEFGSDTFRTLRLAYGDLNGDGSDDLYVLQVDRSSDVYSTSIFYGPLTGGTYDLEDGDVHILPYPLTGDDYVDSPGDGETQITNLAAGDFNGDGFSDVLLGNRHRWISAEEAYEGAHLFFGSGM